MGIDVSHIIRHDFRGINNPKKVHGYIQKTIRLLKEKFCIHLKDEDPRFEIYCEDLDDVRFTLPPYSCMFFLREGFWQIESNYHYCRLFMPYDNVYRLRDYIYDIARALGQNEE